MVRAKLPVAVRELAAILEIKNVRLEAKWIRGEKVEEGEEGERRGKGSQ